MCIRIGLGPQNKGTSAITAFITQFLAISGFLSQLLVVDTMAVKGRVCLCVRFCVYHILLISSLLLLLSASMLILKNIF